MDFVICSHIVGAKNFLIGLLKKIFASTKNQLPLRKNNKQPAENEAEKCEAGSANITEMPGSANITENEKYIKKLLVQRSVLTKLTSGVKVTTSGDESQDSKNTESNQSQTNK